MFCITLNNSHFDLIDSIGYVPVGLGESKFSQKFLSDKYGKNICEKNKFYGEYTFHYWLWKNYLDKLDHQWIGFCQYRKFWLKNNYEKKYSNFFDFKNSILKNVPKDDDNFDSIIGSPIFVNQFKLSKFIKQNLITMLKNPKFIINKNNRTIKFHFDMMHGEGNLEKAIDLLETSDRKDFLHYVSTEVSFSPHNMFICKTKNILEKYYNSVFPWLKNCEKIFGFNLKGYGLQRIYGFLAERYMSFWFKKYTKFKNLPIIFKDISDFK